MKKKKDLRIKLKALLSCIDAKEKSLAESKITMRLESLLLHKNINEIGGYIPLEDEVDWRAIHENLKIEVGFPRSPDGKTMKYYKTKSDGLVPGNSFGVRIDEPIGDDQMNPPALIIPGLGFSREGGRLGRGKGFFDRYLEDYAGLKIGICFSRQWVCDLPIERHDILMDIIITEDEILQLRES